MKRIVLDTSFIIEAVKSRIDIFSELARICDFLYKIYVLDKVIEELNHVRKNKPAAKLALALIKDRIKILKTKEGKVDDILAQLSGMGDIIATQDKELKKRLKRYITIRQKKYLMLEKRFYSNGFKIL